MSLAKLVSSLKSAVMMLPVYVWVVIETRVYKLSRCSLLQCPCLTNARFLPADDDPVRPVFKVAEAEGAKYVGIVILLLCFLPVGVLMSMDLLKLISWVKQRHKRRPPTHKKTVSRL